MVRTSNRAIKSVYTTQEQNKFVSPKDSVTQTSATKNSEQRTDDSDGIAEGQSESDRSISADTKTAKENQKAEINKTLKTSNIGRSRNRRGKSKQETKKPSKDEITEGFLQQGATKQNEAAQETAPRQSSQAQNQSPNSEAREHDPFANANQVFNPEPAAPQQEAQEPSQRALARVEAEPSRIDTVNGDVRADLQDRGINTNPVLVDGGGTSVNPSPLGRPTNGIAADNGVVAGGVDSSAAPVVAVTGSNPGVVDNNGVSDAGVIGSGQVSSGVQDSGVSGGGLIPTEEFEPPVQESLELAQVEANLDAEAF